MSGPGQDAGRPPLAIIAAGSSRSAAQPGDSSFDGRAALGLVGLGVVRSGPPRGLAGADPHN